MVPQRLPRTPLLQTKKFAASSIRLKSRRDRRISATADTGSVSSGGDTDGFFKVFSKPECNAKLLALATGQMLCSVATLVHDTYLPVYMQDVLGLSNTKVMEM